MMLAWAIHIPCTILSAVLLIIGAGADLSQGAEELIPREERNLSLRNEVQTALRKGLEHLRAQQAADGLVHFEGSDALGKSARALALLARDLNRYPAELRSPAIRKLRGAIEEEVRKIEPLAKLSTTRQLIQGWSILASEEDEKPAQDALLRELISQQLRVFQESQNSTQASASTEVINFAGRFPKLEDWTDIEWLYYETLPPALRHNGPWQQTPSHQYLLRCQIREGPEAGGFASRPPDVPKTGDRYPATLAATIAGLEYLIANAPESPDISIAFAWLGRHYSALAEQPFPVLRQLTRSLARRKLNTLALPGGQTVDLARAWAERLVNEQEGNGSWPSRKDWVEQDPLALTLEGVELLETLYEAL